MYSTWLLMIRLHTLLKCQLDFSKDHLSILTFASTICTKRSLQSDKDSNTDEARRWNDAKNFDAEVCASPSFTSWTRPVMQWCQKYFYWERPFFKNLTRFLVAQRYNHTDMGTWWRRTLGHGFTNSRPCILHYLFDDDRMAMRGWSAVSGNTVLMRQLTSNIRQ